MSTHTPGPWRFGVYNWEKDVFEEKPFDYVAPGYYDNPEIVGANGESVIGCDEYCVFGSEANARLIAAAPELLEALKLCDEAMNYMSEYDIPIALPAKVKAAIAKATGEIK